MKSLRRSLAGLLPFLLLLTSSTFAEERSRPRTPGRAGRVAEALLGAATGRRGARAAAAVAAVREIGSLIKGRDRRPSPPEWPEETRRPPAPRGRGSQSLLMPVAGVTGDDLRDSFGDPRSGGRAHRGIDIFAPRWTEVVAVTEGTLADVVEGGRAGRSLWLVGRDGRSYFYGHLQAWARGVSDGLDVVPGEVVGYVGNTGNAAGLPTHLHFEIHDGGRAINPYPLLASAQPVQESRRTARR